MFGLSESVKYDVSAVLNREDVVILLAHPYKDDDRYRIYSDGEKLLELYVLPFTKTLSWYQLITQNDSKSCFARTGARFSRRKAKDMLDIYYSVCLRHEQKLKKQSK